METYKKLLEQTLPIHVPSYPKLEWDSFQKGVLSNLFLDIEIDKVFVLFTPEGQVMPIQKIKEDNLNYLEEFSDSNRNLINDIRKYLLFNLAIYTDLLETNSYFIKNNNFLLIARFVPIQKGNYNFEIKYYTTDRESLPYEYKDKIYLGRDFISISKYQRNHFGLDRINASLSYQFKKLKNRYYDFVPESKRSGVMNDFLMDLEESIVEFSQNSEEILPSINDVLAFKEKNKEALDASNNKYKDLKHYLLEISSTLEDWQQILYKGNHNKFARYVTKFRKDIIDDINYINAKVNSRITDYINNVQL